MASEGISFYVISHKTRRSPEYVGSLDLREPAYLWIEDNLQEYGVRKANVFFESSRDEKIQRIISLGITHYIDDLKEVLTDAKFPSEVIKILYDPWSIDSVAKNELITLKHFSELEI